jgi:hypothetical protein
MCFSKIQLRKTEEKERKKGMQFNTSSLLKAKPLSPSNYMYDIDLDIAR